MAIAAGLLATSALAAPPSRADQAALERLAAENDAAWDAANAEVISNQYAIDGNLKLGGTDLNDGRAAIQSYFERSFARRPAGLRHVSQVERIDMVTPNTAFADAHVRLERENADGSRTLLREFRNHSVLVRDGSTWRIRAVRSHPVPGKAAL
jgi:uncharacterized protein (TIGR02246 family)